MIELKMKKYIFGICFGLAFLFHIAHAQEPSAGRQAFVDSPGYFNYLIWLPPNYNPDVDMIWPLMIYLHGGEGLDSDMGATLNENIPGLLQLPAVVDAQYPSLNEFIIVTPLRTDPLWRSTKLDELLVEIRQHYPIDLTRIYLTGFSMGGFGSWAMASAYPQRFAAIAPQAANGNLELAYQERELIFQIIFGPEGAKRGFDFRDAHPEETFVGDAVALAQTPVWAFVADRDPLIPLELVQDFVADIQAAGGDTRLTVINGLLHDVGPFAYNEELFQWMLSHQRAPASSATDWMMYQ
ncbi:MAG: alpha/beta fold hydrolase [Candidatus Hinthialibacter antarcticus]|nr:alpha/beta fold hydrolase [Candidatus Hinthialibacter antarcticus]